MFAHVVCVALITTTVLSVRTQDSLVDVYTWGTLRFSYATVTDVVQLSAWRRDRTRCYRFAMAGPKPSGYGSDVSPNHQWFPLRSSARVARIEHIMWGHPSMFDYRATLLLPANCIDKVRGRLHPKRLPSGNSVTLLLDNL